jgi:3-keto-5-aminohexanoate cleavage enzyme
VSSWDSEPVVIVCAPTGAEVTRELQPALPHTPQEVTKEALAAIDEGATVIHLHAREADGTPSSDPALFSQMVSSIAECSTAITMVSTGGSVEMSIEERLTGLDARPDMAGIETGSLNFGDDIFITSRGDSLRVVTAAAAAGVELEVEAFELGHIHQALRMLERGELNPPLRVNAVFGVPGAVAATPEALDAMRRALPADARWTVTAIGRHQRRMLALAILCGATGIRVGFEDNVYLRRGVLAESNAQLVAAAAALARQLGREVALPEEAREILSLPARTRKGEAGAAA